MSWLMGTSWQFVVWATIWWCIFDRLSRVKGLKLQIGLGSCQHHPGFPHHVQLGLWLCPWVVSLLKTIVTVGGAPPAMDAPVQVLYKCWSTMVMYGYVRLPQHNHQHSSIDHQHPLNQAIFTVSTMMGLFSKMFLYFMKPVYQSIHDSW